MPFNIDVQYLLILVAVAIAIIVVMRALQKSALNRLSQTLYEQNDPTGYLEMLQKWYLKPVLRRSTLALLRLEGHIYAEDETGVRETAAAIEGMKMPPGERLNFYQKAFSFSVANGNADNARKYSGLLESLLKNEKAPDLQAVLSDARLIVGVYIDKNTALLPELKELEKRQSGRQQGLTQYRMAKLYHFAGDGQKASETLKNAEKNLAGTEWQSVVRDALADSAVLEVK